MRAICGPSRATRGEAELDLSIAKDLSLTPDERRRLLGPADPLIDEPIEESPHAPIWPEWSGATPAIGEGVAQSPIREPVAKRLIHMFDAPTTGVGFAACGAGNSETLLITGISSAVTCPDCARLISEHAVVGLTVESFAPKRPSRQRTCSYCNVVGHQFRSCPQREIRRREMAAEARCKGNRETQTAKSGELGSTTADAEPPRSRWLTKNALAHQLPPGPKKREYSRGAAEGIKAYWDRKRAARAAEVAAPAIAAAAPVVCTKSAKSVQDPDARPPATARAKLPPRCRRCIKVGHVEADCPSAAPAPTRDLPTCAESQTDPSCLTAEPQDTDGLARLLLAEGQPVESLDHLLDDDEGTDLTDLVDVPDAEPTVFPDVDRGRCQACGRVGHWANSPFCSLSSENEDPIQTMAPQAPPLVPPSALRIRGKTMANHRLSRVERAELVEYPDDVERPLTREECKSMPRPCPFVTCSHQLYLDVNPENGSIKLNFPHLQVWEMAETCSLDVADRGGITLEEVGAILNLTRERIRQVEVRGLTMMKENSGNELGLPLERNH